MHQLTRHVIVGERGDVKLQHLQVFGDDVSGRARLLVTHQLVVRLDDVGQLVGQIVLGEILMFEQLKISHLNQNIK